MREVVCSNCESINFSRVRTYKHDWHRCNDCGTVHRERRPSYPLDIAPVRWLVNGTPLKKLFGTTLLRYHEVVEEERKFYDLYEKAAADGPKGTKWEPLTRMRIDDFQKLGINIAGKDILEISGGPGFLAQALQNEARRVVVTEFSKPAADGMGRALGIESVKYDYNTDRIEDCVQGKFDLILIIYSIGFCNNLDAFAQSLKAVMHEGTVIYICHSPATLGLMLRWEFDEYTFNRCWEPETVAKCFAEIGYPEKMREGEGNYRYDFQWYNEAGTWIGSWLRRVHRLIARCYRARALRSNASINRELIQKNIKQVFARV